MADPGDARQQAADVVREALHSALGQLTGDRPDLYRIYAKGLASFDLLLVRVQEQATDLRAADENLAALLELHNLAVDERDEADRRVQELTDENARLRSVIADEGWAP